MLLSGSMLLDYLGWQEAGRLVEQAIEAALPAKKVTADFAHSMPGAKEVSTEAFGQLLVDWINQQD